MKTTRGNDLGIDRHDLDGLEERLEGCFLLVAADLGVHHLALSGDVAVNGIRPSLSVRVPLDSDYRDVVSSTVSLYVQVPLN